MKTYTYVAHTNNGAEPAEFASHSDALDYIATAFRTTQEDVGTWEDEDNQTIVWMSQEAADSAEDNHDAIAAIVRQDTCMTGHRVLVLPEDREALVITTYDDGDLEVRFDDGETGTYSPDEIEI
jgi:hypothetical protein